MNQTLENTLYTMASAIQDIEERSVFDNLITFKVLKHNFNVLRKELSKPKDTEIGETNKGWCWITDPREGDVWYPIFIYDDSYQMDGTSYPLEMLKELIVKKAIMPE